MTEAESPAYAVQRRWAALAVGGFLISLIALVSTTTLANRAAQAVREATLRQHQLNEAVARLDHILISLTDAETGQRGYLLTGEERYLAPYESASRALPTLLEELQSLPVPSSSVSLELRAIRSTAMLKLSELATTVRLYAEGHRAASLTQMRSGSGEDYMEELRSHIASAANALSQSRDALAAEVAAATLRS
jgi:CHASE3 domain sensor protein